MVKAFESWLTKNAVRFPFPVFRVKDCGGGRKYRFRGIPHLRLWVSDWAFTVSVDYRGQCIDMISEWDTVIKKNSTGNFYCELCTKGRPRFYKTRDGLLARHTFKPFLEWCVESFRDDNYLMMSGDRGFTMARILSRDEAVMLKRPKLCQFFIVKSLIHGNQKQAMTDYQRRLL